MTRLGAILAFVGLIFLVMVLTSPGEWQWFDARAVRGQETNGLVSYSYHGQSFTLDDTNQLIPSAAAQNRTVYVDPADPANAVLSVRVAQASYSAFVGVPLAGAAVCALASLGRRRRLRRAEYRAVEDGSYRFGWGFSQDEITTYLRKKRG